MSIGKTFAFACSVIFYILSMEENHVTGKHTNRSISGIDQKSWKSDVNLGINLISRISALLCNHSMPPWWNIVKTLWISITTAQQTESYQKALFERLWFNLDSLHTELSVWVMFYTPRYCWSFSYFGPCWNRASCRWTIWPVLRRTSTAWWLVNPWSGWLSTYQHNTTHRTLNIKYIK